MIKFAKKHYKAVLAVAAAAAVLGALAYWQRCRVLEESTESRLMDEEISGEPVQTEFFSSQLDQSEKKVYDLMKQRLDNLEGGIVEFPEALNGTEYLRVTTALENENGNYFYGFYDIPMDDQDVYLKYKNSDLTAVTDRRITKAILFLSCARDIEVSGEYADDGTVSNLEEIAPGLAENTEDGTQQIQKMQDETAGILAEVLDARPAEYGDKRSVDYFLDWMEQNLSYASQAESEAASYTSIKDVIDGIYVYGSTSSVCGGQANALGYARVLASLCRQSGMDSYIVYGKWGKSRISEETYVLCAVEMSGETIYVDASGMKESELGGQRYLSEQEAKNHMEFPAYFDFNE